MNNNWESLIRAIVPLSFMAIWALTSLFNRDAKPKPVVRPTPRPDGARGGGGPRPSGEPPLRFATTANRPAAQAPPRRPPSRPAEDEGIIILSSETIRLDREKEKRFASASTPGVKRATRGKPVVPQRKPEPEPSRTRTKLAGVSQNVNQHLTNTNLELSPIQGMPVSQSLGLTGTTPAAAVAVGSEVQGGPNSVIGLYLADPARLREAFILNEILQPPVSMRTRRIGPAPISPV